MHGAFNLTTEIDRSRNLHKSNNTTSKYRLVRRTSCAVCGTCVATEARFCTARASAPTSITRFPDRLRMFFHLLLAVSAHLNAGDYCFPPALVGLLALLVSSSRKMPHAGSR